VRLPVEVTGSGSIVGNVFDGGMLAPGTSTGSLTIDGSLNLQAGANLTFDLGGRQQGSGYNFIHVTNFVSFLGTLSLSLTSGFLPTATDTFTLMQFSSDSGLFGNALNGGRLLTLDDLGSFEVSYTANSLQISDFESVPSITSLNRNASGSMVLRFTCVTNQNYVIEYTCNLQSGVWTAVSSPVLTWAGPGIGQWVDDGTLTGGSNKTACFYRVGVQLTATPPRLRISRGLAGQTVLQFDCMAGTSAVIEYTANVQSGVWTAVPSPVFTFPGPGLCQWIDDGTLTGGLGGARFYRVSQESE